MSFLYINLLAMPFCENCGNKVSETSKFCSSCGEKIDHVIQEEKMRSSDLDESHSVNSKNNTSEPSLDELIRYKGDDIIFDPKGQAVVELDGKWGVINNKNEWILNPDFEELGDYIHGRSFDEKDYLNAYKNYNWGFINRQGVWIVQPLFEILGVYDDKDFCQAFINNKFGWIDRNGNWLIEPIFEASTYNISVGEFYCEFDKNGFCVVSSEGKDGVINRKGEWVIQPIYDFIYDFDENGNASAVLNDKEGLINQYGQWNIIQESFDPSNIFESYFNNKLAKKVYLKENLPKKKLEAFCKYFDCDFISKCSFFVYYDDTIIGDGNFGYALVKHENGNWHLLLNFSNQPRVVHTFREGCIRIPLDLLLSMLENATFYNPIKEEMLKRSLFFNAIIKSKFSKTSLILRNYSIYALELFLKGNGDFLDSGLDNTRFNEQIALINKQIEYFPGVKSSIKSKAELIPQKSTSMKPKDSAGIR